MAQQVAHLTSNGASLRTGDLLATGTISGPERGTRPDNVGSLMEMGGGEERWLADGDTVSIRAWCGPRDGGVSFGEVTGTILAARPREAR
jgi:fumarylacetoacetase